MRQGTFTVYSPEGSEVLAQFHYGAGHLSRLEARDKASAARLHWKTKRSRVGISETRAPR